MGYFSYDAVRLSENIPDKNPKDAMLTDDVFFGFYSDIVAFDNREHKLLLITTIFTEETPSMEKAYKEACFRLGSLEDKLAVRLASSGAFDKESRRHYLQLQTGRIRGRC